MADKLEQENSGSEITITVKTPKDKREIKINADSTVKEVNDFSGISLPYILLMKNFQK